MKLLSPVEIESRKQTEITRDIARTESVREALSDAQLELNQNEANFDVSLARQREVYIKMEIESLEKLDEIKKEIEIAEKRREKALIPIDDVSKKAYDNLQRSESILKEADLQKVKNEEIEKLLIEKLDDVGAKEIDLNDREQKIVVKETAIKDQTSQIKTMSESLNGEWQKLHASIAEYESKNKIDTDAISKWNTDLISREKNLAEEKLLSMKQIAKEKALIKDREDTLEREIKRQKINGECTT